MAAGRHYSAVETKSPGTQVTPATEPLYRRAGLLGLLGLCFPPTTAAQTIGWGIWAMLPLESSTSGGLETTRGRCKTNLPLTRPATQPLCGRGHNEPDMGFEMFYDPTKI